jgi:UDP-N-acetylglucosamine 2-epimerase (non-hydrolysing)
MKTIVHVMGARPNYMKIAPVMEALAGVPGVRQLLINTGQHYDEAMSGVFIRELDLPRPDRDLGVGSASHAVQTSRVMMAFEEVCLETAPDLVVVVGDVNSTLAAALVAAKLRIPVAHVEAGLRSFDRDMPEEINRLVTDAVADLLLTPSADADENLRREGVPQEKIFRVGNVMIDTLEKHLPHARFDRVRDRFDLRERGYAVVTLHRPSNVDDPGTLDGIVSALRRIAGALPVVFPVHPRTRARLAAEVSGSNGLVLTEPLGYLDFLSLTSHARIVLTDSGGLQEETTALGIPCLTIRENTERPVTVSHGTNELVGAVPERILAGFERALTRTSAPRRPELWDGQTAGRIAGVLRGFLHVSTRNVSPG